MKYSLSKYWIGVAILLVLFCLTSAAPPDFNPYKVLGVNRSASIDSIKKAYKTRALRLHPDKNPNRDANTQFAKLQAAHEILSDPTKRENYDKTGDPDVSPSANPFGFGGDGRSSQYPFGFSGFGFRNFGSQVIRESEYYRDTYQGPLSFVKKINSSEFERVILSTPLFSASESSVFSSGSVTSSSSMLEPHHTPGSRLTFIFATSSNCRACTVFETDVWKVKAPLLQEAGLFATISSDYEYELLRHLGVSRIPAILSIRTPPSNSRSFGQDLGTASTINGKRFFIGRPKGALNLSSGDHFQQFVQSEITNAAIADGFGKVVELTEGYSSLRPMASNLFASRLKDVLSSKSPYEIEQVYDNRYSNNDYVNDTSSKPRVVILSRSAPNGASSVLVRSLARDLHDNFIIAHASISSVSNIAGALRDLGIIHSFPRLVTTNSFVLIQPNRGGKVHLLAGDLRAPSYTASADPPGNFVQSVPNSIMDFKSLLNEYKLQNIPEITGDSYYKLCIAGALKDRLPHARSWTDKSPLCVIAIPLHPDYVIPYHSSGKKPDAKLTTSPKTQQDMDEKLHQSLSETGVLAPAYALAESGRISSKMRTKTMAKPGAAANGTPSSPPSPSNGPLSDILVLGSSRGLSTEEIEHAINDTEFGTSDVFSHVQLAWLHVHQQSHVVQSILKLYGDVTIQQLVERAQQQQLKHIQKQKPGNVNTNNGLYGTFAAIAIDARQQKVALTITDAVNFTDWVVRVYDGKTPFHHSFQIPHPIAKEEALLAETFFGRVRLQVRYTQQAISNTFDHVVSFFSNLLTWNSSPSSKPISSSSTASTGAGSASSARRARGGKGSKKP